MACGGVRNRTATNRFHYADKQITFPRLVSHRRGTSLFLNTMMIKTRPSRAFNILTTKNQSLKQIYGIQAALTG